MNLSISLLIAALATTPTVKVTTISYGQPVDTQTFNITNFGFNDGIMKYKIGPDYTFVPMNDFTKTGFNSGQSSYNKAGDGIFRNGLEKP